MNEYLPFIVAGLTTGAVYGLAGVGLVLTYKTSGIFNFAHGALATVAAFVFYSLHIDQGWAWLLGCPRVRGRARPVDGLRARATGTGTNRRGAGACRSPATVGLLLVIQSGVILLYDQQVVRSCRCSWATVR